MFNLRAMTLEAHLCQLVKVSSFPSNGIMFSALQYRCGALPFIL